MDNLSCYKRRCVREAIEEAGCRLLHIPLCSPDPNPIEQASFKLEALLRKADEWTVEGLWRQLDRRVHAQRSSKIAMSFRMPGCILLSIGG